MKFCFQWERGSLHLLVMIELFASTSKNSKKYPQKVTIARNPKDFNAYRMMTDLGRFWTRPQVNGGQYPPPPFLKNRESGSPSSGSNMDSFSCVISVHFYRIFYVLGTA